MADTEGSEANGTVNVELPNDENENNESSDEQDNNLLHPGGTLPRRSSLVKDSTRKQQRKKTVSFSSMPNERTVVNGKRLS